MDITTALIFTDLEYSFSNNSVFSTEGTYNESSLAINSTNNTTPIPQSNSNAKYYPIIAAEMILSCLCLIFSIYVYSTLPDFRNVHGKNLIAMSSCLLITFIMLILDLIVRNHIPFAVCFTIAMIIHITFLGNFFWTNVMAFDIWRSLTNMKAKSETKSQSNKYIKYSVYAWVATVLTALPAAVLEATDWVAFEYRPRFGERRCWLSGTTAFIYYFNLPVGVILFVNLILFLLTLRKLHILKKMTAILNVKQQQKRLYLYLKLFLIMGITWSTEFVPWAVNVRGLYAVAGMLTALHGCTLFFIFVCKKKILRQVRQKMGGKAISPTHSSNLQTTSSSNGRTQADSKC